MSLDGGGQGGHSTQDPQDVAKADELSNGGIDVESGTSNELTSIPIPDFPPLPGVDHRRQQETTFGLAWITGIILLFVLVSHTIPFVMGDPGRKFTYSAPSLFCVDFVTIFMPGTAIHICLALLWVRHLRFLDTAIHERHGSRTMPKISASIIPQSPSLWWSPFPSCHY